LMLDPRTTLTPLRSAAFSDHLMGVAKSLPTGRHLQNDRAN
jgi:hypothetical protein